MKKMVCNPMNLEYRYHKSVMWQGWIDDPKSFVKWYLEHYYECGDRCGNFFRKLFKFNRLQE